MTNQIATDCLVVASSMLPAIALLMNSWHLRRGMNGLSQALDEAEAQRQADHAAIIAVIERGRLRNTTHTS